jgi:hypothetical protein
MIHLHWLWRHPQRIGDVAKAIAACGVKGLKKGQWTKHVDDCTCKQCVACTTRKEVEDVPPPVERKTKYKNKRPESPKGRVFSAFNVDGRDAAVKLGQELGLPASKLKRWLDIEWAK